MQFAELPAKIFLPTRRGSARTRWFSPQTGSGISLAWWRGLPDFLEGPTVANRGLSGLSAPSLPSHPCRGVGKFEGEGGFSGTLPEPEAFEALGPIKQGVWDKTGGLGCPRQKGLQTRVLSTFGPKMPSRPAF